MREGKSWPDASRERMIGSYCVKSQRPRHNSSNCANDKFEYYVDYDLVATSPSMGFCNGQSLTAGMELAEPGGVSDGVPTNAGAGNLIFSGTSSSAWQHHASPKHAHPMTPIFLK